MFVVGRVFSVTCSEICANRGCIFPEIFMQFLLALTQMGNRMHNAKTRLQSRGSPVAEDGWGSAALCKTQRGWKEKV